MVSSHTTKCLAKDQLVPGPIFFYYILLLFSFLNCCDPCTITSCRRAGTEKAQIQIPSGISLLFLKMKLTSSFSIKVVFISSQARDPNQFSLRITQLGLHYLLHPASETHLTQQPPVPVQIKTQYPELSKASFHFCICRSLMILWTGLLLTFCLCPPQPHSPLVIPTLNLNYCSLRLHRSD